MIFNRGTTIQSCFIAKYFNIFRNREFIVFVDKLEIGDHCISLSLIDYYLFNLDNYRAIVNPE